MDRAQGAGWEPRGAARWALDQILVTVWVLLLGSVGVERLATPARG